MNQTAPTPPHHAPAAIGAWRPTGAPPTAGPAALVAALRRVRAPFYLVDAGGGPAVGYGGGATLGDAAPAPGTFPLLAYVPACPPEALGDPAFAATHGLRYPYVTGSMANAIASAEIVEAAARAGMLGFFGAAGLAPARVEAAIDRLATSLPGLPYGFNLIHSPNEPKLEAEVVELYLRRGIKLVEASAYLDLTLPIVRYRVSGLRRDADGRVVAPNRVIAKVSRVELAQKFLAPPPERFLRELLAAGTISAEQAELAARIPMADDVTGEADSGGHTDNRPLVCMLPAFLALRDRMQAQYGYAQAPRIGAAGGIATPGGTAAAFALGAAYVVTGSINQACAESGSSDLVRDQLAQAGQADTIMAPAADMFEMGVKVQVLKRGTMFAMRAAKLYELYRTYESLEAIPAPEKAALERDLLRAPAEEIWRSTREFFLTRDPAQVTRAEAEPRHKMALVFRWYLGLSSRWANAGEPTRRLDYQVWCGPAMGAFNEWAAGSFLAARPERRIVPVALNLLVGAAALTRARLLRTQGIHLPPEADQFPPQRAPELDAFLRPA